MKYYRPESLASYWDLRQALTGKPFLLLAGGTDLVPRFERGVAMPDHLVDLKHISELQFIRVSNEHIDIGALCTIQQIHDHKTIESEFRALHLAAHEFAGPQIRHRGTLGGNICNASPAGDLLPALYAFDAQVLLVSEEGERQLPIQEFITGPGQSQLKAGELLLGLRLNRKGFASHFEKVGLRQSMAISVVNIAVVFNADAPSFTYLNIAAGSVAPTVVMLEAFSSAFLNQPEALQDQLDLIDKDIAPIDDIRATARYRRRVLKNLIQHFLNSRLDEPRER